MSVGAPQAYKRYVTIVLLLVYIFNQVDRGIFGILMEPIKRDLHLSDTELGFLAGPALVIFYAILGIPIARLADRVHRINIMTIAVTLWSAIVVLSAAVTNFWQFALARTGVGIGEAGFSAVAQSVIADYHHPRERTRAMAVFMLAIPLGGVVSSLLAGWVNQLFGWRAVFIAAGLPGIALALLMKRTVREPMRSASAAAGDKPPAVVPLREVFAVIWQRPALRHLAIAMTLMNLTAGCVVGWQATFFVRIHAMQTGELGTWLALIYAVGGGAGVWLSGNLGRIGGVAQARTQTRLLAMTSVLAWPAMLTMLLVGEREWALGFAFLATLLLNFFFAPSFALVQGLSAPRMRATVIAIIIFFQILFAGVIGLQLAGILSDLLVSTYGPHALRWAIVALTPAALWAALHFWLSSHSIEADAADLAESEPVAGSEPTTGSARP